MTLVFGNFLASTLGVNTSAVMLTNIEWFIGFITIFGGIIAALAIFLAFKRADMVHEKTQKLLLRDKRMERKIMELRNISSTVIDFIAQVHGFNIQSPLHKQPKSEQELQQRKQYYLQLYTEVETSFSQIFTSGLLFGHCEKCISNMQSSREQLDMLIKQKHLAEIYRALYRCIHDYISFTLEKLDTIYVTENIWIWEAEAASRASGHLTQEQMNEAYYKAGLINSINKGILEASKEDANFKHQLNEMAIQLRNALVEYAYSYMRFEDKLFIEEVTEQVCTENHLELFNRMRGAD